MEDMDHPNCILDWPFLHQEKSTEELTQSLWSTTMELEATRARVQAEIRARDDELNQLKHLLNDAINERNEARNKYQSLLLDKLLLQNHRLPFKHHQNTNHPPPPPPQSGVSSIEDEPITTNCGFSSSDCEESIVSSPPIENPIQLPFPPPPPELELRFPVEGLPEKGKFLETVMKAGPLLQNLLLAGPLPHWHHPPPPIDTYQIPSPPLLMPTNYGDFNKKRGFSEDRDSSSTENKYQRITLYGYIDSC